MYLKKNHKPKNNSPRFGWEPTSCQGSSKHPKKLWQIPNSCYWDKPEALTTVLRETNFTAHAAQTGSAEGQGPGDGARASSRQAPMERLAFLLTRGLNSQQTKLLSHWSYSPLLVSKIKSIWSKPIHDSCQMNRLLHRAASAPLVPQHGRHRAGSSSCSGEGDPCQSAHIHPLQLVAGQNAFSPQSCWLLSKRDFGENFQESRWV